MESINPDLEQERKFRAEQFIELHEIERSQYKAYYAERWNEVSEGKTVWRLQRPDTPVKVYDLFRGRNGRLASINAVPYEEHFIYSLKLFPQNEWLENEVDKRVHELRADIDPNYSHTKDSEIQVLGYLLEIAAQYEKELAAIPRIY